MNKINQIFVLLIIAALSFLYLNYNQSKKDNTIKIGATLDFTGPNAVYGEQVKQGIDLAVEQINQKGGINNKLIEVIYQDSKSDPKLAVTNTQKFLTVDDIKIIIGEISSSATQSMIPVVEQNNAFLFAPASSSPKLTNISKNFARNWPSDLAEAGNAAEYASKYLKAKTASVIFVNSDYGLGLKEKFHETFNRNGGSIVSSEPYPVENNDFKTLLLKIKSSSPECIYLAGNPKEMGRCIKQMRELGINVPVISNTGFLQNDCLSIAGKFSEGVIIPTPSYDPKDSKTGEIANFFKMFTDKYKKDPTMVNANGYDAVKLISESIQNFGVDPVKIAEYIRNKKGFNGAAGLINFTDGDVESPIVFKIIKSGKPEILNP